MEFFDAALKNFKVSENLEASQFETLQRLNKFILDRSNSRLPTFNDLLQSMDSIDHVFLNHEIGQCLETREIIEKNRDKDIVINFRSRKHRLKREYKGCYLYLNGLKAARLNRRRHTINDDFVANMSDNYICQF